jgi:phosphatidylglycerol:prolipoprotein diacylglycerol transferase
MITISMNPILFSVGGFEIRWYGLMVVLAILSIIAISLLEAKRVGLPQEHIYNAAVWAIIGGILGSRLIHVIDQWDYYIANPSQILRFEGLAVYGAVIGILAAIIVYSLVKKISIWQLGDIVSPGALVGMAIGRIGCIINGCCYGLPTNFPFAVIYTNPNAYAPLGQPLHFTQLYHLIWNLIAFGIVWSLRRRLKPQGSIVLLYLALYAAGDLIVRFFRYGEPFLFGMQQAQLIGIIVLVITVPWMIVRIVRARAQKPAGGEPDDEATGTEQSQAG